MPPRIAAAAAAASSSAAGDRATDGARKANSTVAATEPAAAAAAAPSSSSGPQSTERTPLLAIHVLEQSSGGAAGQLHVPSGGGTFAAASDAKTPRSILRAALESENHGYPAPSPFTPQPVVFTLYGTRWYVLALFSLMALFNNAICYTVGSVYRVSRRYYYGGHGALDNPENVYDLANLVSCYFLSYCIFSFPTSWFIERYGLKAGVLSGAWLQVMGCFVRVLATPTVVDPTDGTSREDHEHGSLWMLLAGQAIASLGQAFFVNPPPLLAAIWFGVNERTLATTIACNANTLGIAAAYMIGPLMVDTVDDLPAYMLACFLAALLTAIMATIYFPAAPPTPPSHSQVEPAAFPAIAEEEIAPSGSPIDVSSSPNASGSSSSSGDLLALPVTEGSEGSSSGSGSEDDEPEHGLFGHSQSAQPLPSNATHPPAPAHSRSAPARHMRVRSQGELAIAASYNSMSEPPCAFVQKEAILAERERSKNASRIITSARMFKRMFAAPGFIHTLMVFGVAEATINGFAAFMFMIVEPWGYHSMQLVGIMVCAFIGMCMVGSAVIGWLVDLSKAFKQWIVISLVGSAVGLLYLIFAGPLGAIHVWTSICIIGFFMGPVQPLSIETAVEVTYPAPESSVTAVQQVLGNLFSAAIFPLIILCRNPETQSMQPALFLVLFCLLGTGLFYLTFDGQYRRLAHEVDREEKHREVHRKLHEEAQRAHFAAVQKHKMELITKLNAANEAAKAKEQQGSNAVAPRTR